MVLKHSIVCES